MYEIGIHLMSFVNILIFFLINKMLVDDPDADGWAEPSAGHRECWAGIRYAKI